MSKVKVALFANDYGESQMMFKLDQALAKDHLTDPLLNNGSTRMPDKRWIEEYVSCNILSLVAMSETCDMEVAAANETLRQGKPLILLAFGSWRQKAFEEIVARANVLFVIDEGEALEAREKYPTLNVKVLLDEWVGGTELKVRKAILEAIQELVK